MREDNKQAIKKLRKQFINDNKLPIDIYNDTDYFNYFIQLYEFSFKSQTKWDKLVKTIEEEFDGNPQKFLDNYYALRETIISSISGNPYFKAFNNSTNNLIGYSLPPHFTSLPKKNAYYESNDGKIFLSLDLHCANYSALMFHEPKILGNIPNTSYKDWISKYTDLDYIKNSKYFRQVVFGNLNPSRQITIEKFMISKALDETIKKLKDNNCFFSIYSLSNDEVLLNLPNDNVNNKKVYDIALNIKDTLKNNGIILNVSVFKLKKHQFKNSNDNVITIFQKEYAFDNKDTELKNVPSYYYAQMYKVIHNLALTENDLLFLMAEQLAKFLQPLIKIY